MWRHNPPCPHLLVLGGRVGPAREEERGHRRMPPNARVHERRDAIARRSHVDARTPAPHDDSRQKLPYGSAATITSAAPPEVRLYGRRPEHRRSEKTEGVPFSRRHG